MGRGAVAPDTTIFIHMCARATSICVRENCYLHFLNFVCVYVQQGRHIAHKFERGWEVGVIKAYDKKGPHAGKFSVKYKDDPNWWTHCERGRAAQESKR